MSIADALSSLEVEVCKEVAEADGRRFWNHRDRIEAAKIMQSWTALELIYRLARAEDSS